MVELHYQPTLDMESGPVGVEALVRLRHPKRGVLLPAAFFGALDHPSLGKRIGRLVLDMAMAQAALWQRQGLDLRISVNVSPRHLLEAGFPGDLGAVLDAHPDVPPSRLMVEIAETAPMQDFERTRQALLACASLGVGVALDDFGTGSSPLTSLQKLPVGTVKIDQSFVRDMPHDSRSHAIVSGVVNAGRMAGLEVVAKGVENSGQVSLLSEMACARLQGYAIARPMPAEEVPEWFRSCALHQQWGMLPMSQGCHA